MRGFIESFFQLQTVNVKELCDYPLALIINGVAVAPTWHVFIPHNGNLRFVYVNVYVCYPVEEPTFSHREIFSQNNVFKSLRIGWGITEIPV